MTETIALGEIGGQIPNLQAFQVQDILDKKGKKLQVYQPCDQYWLVIVEEPQFASMFDSCEEILKNSFLSSFDNVFFYRVLNQTYHNLNLKPN